MGGFSQENPPVFFHKTKGRYLNDKIGEIVGQNRRFCPMISPILLNCRRLINMSWKTSWSVFGRRGKSRGVQTIASPEREKNVNC
ncbi:hypothetical protein SAMN05216383_12130 [Prevotella sp. KH2C16]|nr:hypothetical protein SAMN05216383_12130 [Prevotella sp. KH2C16]